MYRRGLAVLVSAAALWAAAPAGATTSGPGGLPSEVQTALAQLRATGTLTAAEKRTLRAYPEIAAGVPDPDSAVPLPGRTEPAAGRDGMRARESADGSFTNGEGCWITRTGVRKRSLLGFTQFDYLARIDYCVERGKVTSVHQRYHYLENADGVSYLRGYHNSSPHVSGVGGTRADVAIHGFVELCTIKVGCYASLYPKVEMVISGTGRADWKAEI